MLSRQVTLFREVQSFRLLALATVGSAFGTWLAFVALTIDVYDRTDSAVWVSALLIADFLPAIVIGIAASSLVDRLPRRRLMIASDLARVAIFAVLPFANDPGTIVALAALAGFATGFPSGALRRTRTWCPTRIFPRELAAPDDRERRLGLGPVLEACSLQPRGLPRRTGSIPSRSSSRPPRGHSGPAAAVGPGGGAGLLARPHRRLHRPGLACAPDRPGRVERGHAATAGANVAEVVLAKETFDAGDFGYGLLVGVTGIGLALGSLLAGSQLEHRALATVYATSIGLVAVGMVGAAAAPNVWVAAVSVAVAGTGNGARSCATRCSSSGARRTSSAAVRSRCS